MSKTIFKVFFAFDYEKEQLWINEMSYKGYQLTSVFPFFYTFEENAEDDYIYSLDLSDKCLLFDDAPKLNENCIFIGHIGRWIYTKKKITDTNSSNAININSQIDTLKQVRLMHLPLALCFISLILYSARLFEESPSISTFIILTMILTLDFIGWYAVIKTTSRIKHLQNH